MWSPRKALAHIRKNSRKARGLLRLSLSLALVSAVLVAPAASLLDAEPAHAISFGPGIDVGPYHIGAFVNSNVSYNTYCVELGVLIDLGNTPDLVQVASLNAYSSSVPLTLPTPSGGMKTYGAFAVGSVTGERFDRIRYIVSKWGNTGDNVEAAAVQLAIWKIRGENATGSYQEMLTDYQAIAGPAAVAKAELYVAEAANPPGVSSMPADPRIVLESLYSGYVVADAGTTELTIENAVFVQNDKTKITFDGGTTKQVQLPFNAEPVFDANSWNRFHEIKVNGKYRYEVYGPVSVSSVSSQNTSGAKSFWHETGSYKEQIVKSDTLWMPVLSSEVSSRFVAEGEEFNDHVIFDVAPDSNEWRRSFASDGSVSYAPIVAKGTLYGPFLNDPALNPQLLPPAGAPVAAEASVVSEEKKGPGKYLVETPDGLSLEPGYYSWVWNIEFEHQLPAVKEPAGAETSLPQDYFYTDGFGQVTETQIIPSNITFSTQLSADSLSVAESFTDEISVYLGKGGWLQGSDGKRLPFKLRGEIYVTHDEPVRQASVPENARLIDTVYVVTDSPNQVLQSPAVKIPVATAESYVTARWCLLNEDQTSESMFFAAEWCDDFGVPSETAKILRPEVVTQAQPEAAVFDVIKDTAIITGGVPKREGVLTEVQFTAYLKPEPGEQKYDTDWAPMVDEEGEPLLWSADEIESLADVCVAQPVGQTARVKVTSQGSIESPGITAESSGTIYWVEELYITDETGEHLLHSGECGLPNETTLVLEPTVRTKAVAESSPGGEVFDTAIVTGPVTGSEFVKYELTFEAFHVEEQAERIDAVEIENLCSNDNLLWQSSESIPVSEAGEYESEKWQIPEDIMGEIFWVETLTKVVSDDNGETRSPVHRGQCGEPEEITQILESPPSPLEKLVETGFAMTNLNRLVIGSLLIGLGFVLASVLSRRLIAKS